MAQPELMKVQYKHTPEGKILKYNIQTKVTANNTIYIHIKKGIYGLRKVAIIAYDNMKLSLKPFEYAPLIVTVGVWKHNTPLTILF